MTNMSIESTARIPCLLIIGACMHRCLTPPQPPAAKKDQARAPPPTTFAERTILRLNGIPFVNLLNAMKVGVWIPALAECALVLANNGLLPAGWNEHVLRLITGTPLRTLAARTLPPVLLAGASLAALGTSIRIAAYDALGKQFTYEVAIRDDYALVTTFPYTLVRHPSYLGSAATIAGVGCMLAPWDGWARAVFVPWLVSRPRTLGKVAAGAAATGFVGFNLLTLVMFHSRAGAEDRMLRRQFGRRWDEWAERVPNQIIPYVW